jgi:hypothetical protein
MATGRCGRARRPDVEVLAPVPEGKVEEGVLGKHDFGIDMSAGTVGGHTVKVSVYESGSRSANFTRAMCRDCPLKQRCCPNRPRRQIRIMDREQFGSWTTNTTSKPDAGRCGTRPSASICAGPGHGSTACSELGLRLTGRTGVGGGGANVDAAGDAEPAACFRVRGRPRPPNTRIDISGQ